MTNPLLGLADLAADWQARPLSDGVRRAVRHATLDWFATTLPGTVRPPATLLAAVDIGLDGGADAGGALCYVDGRYTSPRRAAFINATASHTVEFDDIFRDGGYHPGSPTIAAALAVAQSRGASREAFDRAVIGGYEAGCRLALALQPSHYDFWHITGTVGTIGAAVAGAMLLGCDRDGVANAIAISTSFAGGHQQNFQGESMVKALHAGHAADAGLLAAYAARAGITGALDSLHGAKGYASATSDGTGNWDAAFEGAGAWTPITRMTVKIHGCCGHIFAALDGLETLRVENGFGSGEIAAIHVEGYGPTKSICDRPNPMSAQEARFSLQYCLAAQLVLGGVRLAAFEPEALANAEIRKIMPGISVECAQDLAEHYPRRRMARLKVRLTDGRELHHFQSSRRGDPDNPIAEAELIAKFDELAGTVLLQGEADRLRRLILESDELPGTLRTIT
ncbi:MmgE/PrpD family protein [Nitratireductor sp. ZSWI3]|uniref:MmgE/PrpD family protein n=1 Tax=Nitratireductor sp. ZSWI3 TaxID=2966359 RepID=UPI00214F68EB|nr:MmgE/PrpD family protein [Nitratireductor sp. ZSWI3]MCR4265159.1 MmgE/PrpD family protein [Nitratireductor sp. ZSWI3]